MLIHLFGGLRLSSPKGDPVRLTTRKASLLLAALAVAGPNGARRELLCDLFWPERGEQQARGSLRQAMAAIRQVAAEVGGGAVTIDGDAEVVRLVVEPSSVDVQLFEQLITRTDADSLSRAADLYMGDLLAEVSVPEPADQWFAPHRQAARSKALRLCEALAGLASAQQGNVIEACQGLADRLLLVEPAAEEAHRALIRLHLIQGRTNAALQQYERCKEALRRDLQAEPEAKTRKLISDGPHGPAENSTDVPTGMRLRRTDQPSIVVMPFDNLSGADDEYFVDGIVEEITAALSRVRDFFVIARQSAFVYKGRFVDVREIGKRFDVQYVVEGTIRRGGRRLRISAQLVDAETRAQLWSNRYEGEIENIFEFQDRIAAQITGSILPAIRGAEIDLAVNKPPANLRAYDLVMRAYPYLWGRRKEANQRAIELLEEAIAADPTYGRAYALLAWGHASNAAYLWSGNPETELEKARMSIEAAGSINEDPTALAAAGAALSICGDQDRASTLVERALALDPNNAWAWTRFGWIAIYKGDAAGAIERFQRAVMLSPMDPMAFNMKLGIASAMARAGDFRDAISIVREIIADNPDIVMSYRYLAAWSALDGDLETARWAGEKMMAVQPDFAIEKYRSLPFFRNIPEWAENVAKALKLAGLPER